MSDNLTFASSERPTLGVELELQILDPETGDLAPGGLRILDGCKEEGIDGVSDEFLLSMLEVKTDVCDNVLDVRESLYSTMRRVRNVASSLGFDLALGGTHPFARPSMAAIFPNERYQRIQKIQGWMAYQEAIFGLHIHVGVPDGNAAIGVINQVVEYIPHLLTLASNSPFWQGVDTNYASTRLRMFRPSGSAGLPPHLKNWEAFQYYSQVMQEAGIQESTKDMYWDIRPQHKFGTVEFRIFDVPSSLATVLSLCSLTQCLVVDTLQRLEEQRELAEGDERTYWLANENRWLATRFGMETKCVRRPGQPRDTLSNDVTRLIDRLLPIAEALGTADHLRALYPAQFETGSERKRHLYRQHGNWLAVLDDMRRPWIDELDEDGTTYATTKGARRA